MRRLAKPEAANTVRGFESHLFRQTINTLMKLKELNEARYAGYPNEIKLLVKWLGLERKRQLRLELDPEIDPEKIISLVSKVIGSKQDVDFRGRSPDLDADGIVAWVLGRWTVEFNWIYDELNLLITGQTKKMGYVDLNEARYYRKSMRDINDYINSTYYVWGEDFVGERGLRLTIEELGNKYDIHVDFSGVSVDPRYPSKESHQRAKEIEKDLGEML